MPSDAEKELAKLYDDDAQEILAKWNDLYDALGAYDENVEAVQNAELTSSDELEKKYANFDLETADKTEVIEALDDTLNSRIKKMQLADALSAAAAKELLESYEYGDGTMLDFFMQTSDEIADDITVLYPLVEALSAGQRSTLEFMSLLDLRAKIHTAGTRLDALGQQISSTSYKAIPKNSYDIPPEVQAASDEYFTVRSGKEANEKLLQTLETKVSSTGRLMKSIAIGFTVASVAFAAVSLYFTYRDLVNSYKIEFTPIPRYMVDEKDITAYNAKGEKIVVKNQTAYYAAAECNRAESDEMFSAIGNVADLNGTVGKQWIALYYTKNEMLDPILADSLVAKVADSAIPAGYTTGIHMFGQDTAFNLNTGTYVWNNGADSVFVYYKTDSAAATGATGTVLTTGTAAITGVVGLALGALVTALAMTAAKKKKKTEA